MKRVLVVNGPNLNLLGVRQPTLYGSTTLAELDSEVTDFGRGLDIEVETFQSNHEGALIDRIQVAREDADGLILNGGAFTHYSYAIHDALLAAELPTIEVHISNLNAREAWRRVSVTAPACVYSIQGRGTRGYTDALRRLVSMWDLPGEVVSYGDHLPDHYGELRVPSTPGPHRVCVLIHGGFWRDPWKLDLMDRLAIDLTRRGWATWNIEYRRVGDGGGIPETPNDVARALEGLNGMDDTLELARVAVVGHSAGGQLAQWLAGEQLDGVVVTRAVSLAGVSDLVLADRLHLGDGAVADLFGAAMPLTETDLARYSPFHREIVTARQLVVHGTADDRVPVEMADRYVQKAKRRGDVVSFHREEGADHFSLVDPASPAWHAVADWLES